MADLRDFFTELINTMRKRVAENADDFHGRFSGKVEYRRCKTCSPRTDLILGTSGNRKSGIVSVAADTFLSQKGVREVSYDRYMDFAAFGGNWFAGTRIPLLAGEIENNIAEFKGTISDLIRYQARAKFAIFYDSSAPSRQEQIRKEIHEVFDCFRIEGFMEASTTEYLIVFGPSELEVGSGIGQWCALWLRNESEQSPISIKADPASFVHAA